MGEVYEVQVSKVNYLHLSTELFRMDFSSLRPEHSEQFSSYY